MVASIIGKPFVFVLMILAITLLTTFGCSEPYPLSGMVEVDGKPIERGSIVFQADTEREGSGPSATTRISQGKFLIPAGQKVPVGPTIATITDDSQAGRKLTAEFYFPPTPTEDFLIVAHDARDESP
jgi:hypothetical protein